MSVARESFIITSLYVALPQNASIFQSSSTHLQCMAGQNRVPLGRKGECLPVAGKDPFWGERCEEHMMSAWRGLPMAADRSLYVVPSQTASVSQSRSTH